MKVYTGIGSRETPQRIQSIMTEIARFLSSTGWTLRSGGAPGADTAFELGADAKEIYLPWRGFNSNPSTLYTPSKAAFKLTEQYHPTWSKCSDAARKLHARNCHQVLGPDLMTPSKFVICWTKDGMASGGTGQALRIAEAHHITIFNLQIQDHLDRICSKIGA